MKRSGGIALCGVVLAALSACSTHSLEELRRTEPKGSAFQVTLANLYLDFASQEEKDYDWKDSWYFADKGLLAAYGNDVAPESLEAWDIPADVLPTLQEARTSMMAALTPEAVQAQPELAAQVVFQFDCWVEQQEENWQPEDIAECRDGFKDSLAELVAGPAPEDDAPGAPVHPAPKPTKAKKKIDKKQPVKKHPAATASKEAAQPVAAAPAPTPVPAPVPVSVPNLVVEPNLAADVQQEMAKEELSADAADITPLTLNAAPLAAAEPGAPATAAKPSAVKPGGFNPPPSRAAAPEKAKPEAQTNESYLLYFEQETNQPAAKAQETLNMLAAGLGADAGYSFSILVRDANEEKPSKLFASRAQSVKQHLVSLGVNPKAITIVSSSSGTPSTTTSRKVELFIHD